MATIVMNGRITPGGKLEVELPAGLPSGEVRVIVEIPDGDETRWTDEEIRQALQVMPKTGAEIAALLDDMEPGFQHISESAAWVEEQRRRHRQNAQW